MTRTPLEALDRACALFEGQQFLADAIGIKSPSISYWRNKGEVPEERCEPIETATRGEVRCEELRPDLHWQRNAAGQVVGVARKVAPTRRPHKRISPRKVEAVQRSRAQHAAKAAETE